LDQAGKARVIAITNWWIQLVLKPLHDSIFAALSKIDQDGTFNQSRPLDLILENKRLDCELMGFDLSSATDRLPVQLQADILNILGFDGNN
jgi:hypothetical protein